jgi:ribosomal protein S18 acetylase RimI-like enzyme
MDISPEELLALYDSEMRSDPPPEPGITYERRGGVVRGTGPFNFIYHSTLTAATVDAAIAEQVMDFSSPPLELQWKVYGHDQPANLGERLVAAGFTLEEPETFMVLRLSDYPAGGAAPPGVDIRRVSDLSGLEDYVAVANTVFGGDESWRIGAYGPRLGEPTLGIYVAYADGEAVSSGRLEMPKGKPFASIWGGGTLESFRGRGIYKALVDARAREAIRMGFRYLTVDAREPSRPILERLGFVPLAGIRDYTINKSAHQE